MPKNNIFSSNSSVSGVGQTVLNQNVAQALNNVTAGTGQVYGTSGQLNSIKAVDTSITDSLSSRIDEIERRQIDLSDAFKNIEALDRNKVYTIVVHSDRCFVDSGVWEQVAKSIIGQFAAHNVAVIPLLVQPGMSISIGEESGLQECIDQLVSKQQLEDKIRSIVADYNYELTEEQKEELEEAYYEFKSALEDTDKYRYISVVDENIDKLEEIFNKQFDGEERGSFYDMGQQIKRWIIVNIAMLFKLRDDKVLDKYFIK